MNYQLFILVIGSLFLIYVLFGAVRTKRKQQNKILQDVEDVFREFSKTLNQLIQPVEAGERKYSFEFLVRASRDLRKGNTPKSFAKVQRVPKLKELFQSHQRLQEHIQDCFKLLVHLAQRPVIVDHKRKLEDQVYTVWLSVMFDTRSGERGVIWVCTSKDTPKESIFADALAARFNQGKEWNAIRSLNCDHPSPVDNFKVEFL